MTEHYASRILLELRRIAVAQERQADAMDKLGLPPTADEQVTAMMSALARS